MIAVSEEKAAELIPERPQEKGGQGTTPHEAEADNVYAVTPEEADALIPEAGTRNKPQTPESEGKAAAEQDTDTAPVKKSGKRRLKKEVVWALHGMIFAAVAIAIGTRVFATPLYNAVKLEAGSPMPEAGAFSPRSGADIRYATEEEIASYLATHPDAGDRPADPDRVGVYTVYLKCGSEIRTVQLIVEDTTPPVIDGAEDRTVFAGDAADFSAGVTVSDNHDQSPRLDIDVSTVNMEEPGTYIAIYHAEDSAGNVTNVGTFVHVEAADSENNPRRTIPQSASITGVEPLSQMPELPTGCEVTSLAMALDYAGYKKADKTELAEKHLPKAEQGEAGTSPYTHFIGDPADAGSYGCYAGAIVACAESFGAKAEDVSGCSLDTLLAYVSDGRPVIVWATSDMVPTTEGNYRYIKPDGTAQRWKNNEHCLLMTGYDINENTVEMADPEKGEIVRYRMTMFLTRWEEQDHQAVIVY